MSSGCRTVSNNGSGLAPARNIFEVQVHSSKILLVQVRFGFTDLKFKYRYLFRTEKKLVQQVNIKPISHLPMMVCINSFLRLTSTERVLNED